MLKNFKSIKITLASQDNILSWSHGEVKKAETINYRSLKAEPDGLMCEKIFGPSKNFECYCGKYKKIRYKGITCDKCGVEVTHKGVRRERMGHIRLAAPVTHIWYSHGAPNKLALILDIPQGKLESVIYFSRHIVLEINEDDRHSMLDKADKLLAEKINEINLDRDKQVAKIEKNIQDSNKNQEISNVAKDISLKQELAKIKQEYKEMEEVIMNEFSEVALLIKKIKIGEVLTEEQLNTFEYENLKFFRTGIGAEAIFELLGHINNNMIKIIDALEIAKDKSNSILITKKIIDRYRILKGMYDAKINPQNIVMQVIPISPAELRPIVQLPGGRYATADINDLYRRVINRNNRLKKLLDIGAPELILRNEKRMLQEAVDVLIDNSHRPTAPVLNTKQQPYKSLSDTLRGKQGRFRQNLLGKRVDYSGRSVIVVGPEMSVYECGLPQDMALELFRPYVIREIILRDYAANTKSAKVYFEEKHAEVYDILEEVIKGRPVLLNRAPTLHKQGIQAFYPVLVSGNAIRLHPLVCKGFNADFDGDQMAVHVPLSKAAQKEAIDKMMPDSNVILMRNGDTVIEIEKEMAGGLYYLTKLIKNESSNDMLPFESRSKALKAYDLNKINLHQEIKLLENSKLIITCVGRVIFNNVLPLGYEFVNEQISKKVIFNIASDLFDKFGSKITLNVMDLVETLGFEHLTKAGFSLSPQDYIVSKDRAGIIDEANVTEDNLNLLYADGMIGDVERAKLSQKLWVETTDNVWKATSGLYGDDHPLTFMNKSGALPTESPLKSSVGMKGLIIDLSGRVVELPLRSNYIEGFNAFEYFVGARGTRKGEADKGVQTAKSGYLTRKLCMVSQSVITKDLDCGTNEGILVHRDSTRRMSFEKRILGRVVCDQVKDSSGQLIIDKGEMITVSIARKINNLNEINNLKVRSVLTCNLTNGVCRKCYGMHLGTQQLVGTGFAAGIVAGETLGECSTQLTMDSKHGGAKVGASDVTKGLPRLSEIFECRTPKVSALIAEISGKIEIVETDKKGKKIEVLRIINEENITKTYSMKEDDTLLFSRTKKVHKNDQLVKHANGAFLVAPIDGEVSRIEKDVTFVGLKRVEKEYELNKEILLRVKDGDTVVAGEQMSEGSLDPKALLKYGGESQIHKAQQYVIDQIQDVYGVQGLAIDDRHIEVIVRRMGDFVQIVDSGDSMFVQGELESYYNIKKENEMIAANGGKPIKYLRRILGIAQATLKDESWLSAASFQEQVRVLSEHSLKGSEDNLKDLNTNVIIGRLVPLGENLK